MQDLEPYLLYTEAEDQAEFATWRLVDGVSALALFVDRAAAETYQTAAHLGADWNIYQPDATVLRSIFTACEAAGIHHAVLNPDHEQALRIWKLTDVLQAGDREPSTDPN